MSAVSVFIGSLKTVHCKSDSAEQIAKSKSNVSEEEFVHACAFLRKDLIRQVSKTPFMNVLKVYASVLQIFALLYSH